MAEAEFNRVTRQIIDLCPVLTEEVVDATAAVNDIESRAEELGAVVRREVAAFRERLREVTAAMDALEQKLRDGRQEAERRLDGLQDAIDDAGAAWDAALQAAAGGHDRLAAQLRDAGTALATQAEAAATDVRGLSERLIELESDVAAGQEDAWQALVALGEAADGAWSELDGQCKAWTDAIDALPEAAAAAAASHGSALARTLCEHAREAIDAGNDAIAAHNAALEAAELRYVRFVGEGLDGTADGYMAALEAVDALPATAAAVLDPGLAGLEEAMGLFVTEADELAQALQRDGRLARP